ncbi:MAG TPA: hypothetical protein VKU01_04720 [Bryobacteraceae bacterium]|nr:hypothetical protein [Bryobacteraceae bacterium]
MNPADGLEIVDSKSPSGGAGYGYLNNNNGDKSKNPIKWEDKGGITR